jgi:hypothetical protein
MAGGERPRQRRLERAPRRQREEASARKTAFKPNAPASSIPIISAWICIGGRRNRHPLIQLATLLLGDLAQRGQNLDINQANGLINGLDDLHFARPFAARSACNLVRGAQGLGYPALQAGHDGKRSSLDNALSQARAFRLTQSAARELVRYIAGQVEG